MTGRTWTAEWIDASDVSSHWDEPGAIVKGKIRELTSVTTREIFGTASGLLAFAPMEIDLPFNAGTLTTTVVADREAQSAERNVWRINTCIGDTRLVKHPTGFELEVPAAPAPLRPDLHVRLEEMLTFTLGSPIEWAVYESISQGTCRTVLRSFPPLRRRPRLGPPINWGSLEGLNDLAELQAAYLEFLLRMAPNELEHHPMAVKLATVLRASASDLEDEVLSLCVQLEAVVREHFEMQGAPPQAVPAAIDELIAHMNTSTIEPDLRERAVNMVRGIKRPNPRTAILSGLPAAGLLEERHSQAWDSLRHRAAHGLSVGGPITGIADTCNVVHQALLLLVFHVIGYTGRFTDYTTRGWPLRSIGSSASATAV